MDAASPRSEHPPISRLPSVEGWRLVPIHECGEPLVPLGPFVDPDGPGFSPRIFQDAVYWGERATSPYRRGELEGALLAPFLREGVARRLVQAAASLPRGLGLLIWDAYRPLSVQKALYDAFLGEIVAKRGFPPDAAAREAQRFVSLPLADPLHPSPHATGAAVDLTIVAFPADVLDELDALASRLEAPDLDERRQAEIRRLRILCGRSVLLDMGTPFDAVVPETATRVYEARMARGEALSPADLERLSNRRLLVRVMAEAGFTNYGEEWWHFDSGNQFDAVRTDVAAVCGAAAFSPACRAFEERRRRDLEASPAFHDPAASLHPKADRLRI